MIAPRPRISPHLGKDLLPETKEQWRTHLMTMMQLVETKKDSLSLLIMFQPEMSIHDQLYLQRLSMGWEADRSLVYRHKYNIGFIMRENFGTTVDYVDKPLNVVSFTNDKASSKLLCISEPLYRTDSPEHVAFMKNLKHTIDTTTVKLGKVRTLMVLLHMQLPVDDTLLVESSHADFHTLYPSPADIYNEIDREFVVTQVPESEAKMHLTTAMDDNDQLNEKLKHLYFTLFFSLEAR